MPGWHEATEDLQESGKLQVVGITEEQHPARCRLFFQWKEMEWPVMVDSLNLLGVRAVPISLFIDEHGVVRGRAKKEKLNDFLDAEYEKPEEPAPPERPETSAADAWLEKGRERFLDGHLTEAIEAFARAEELEAGAEAAFRLGVALRRRHESEGRRPGDLQAAFAAWGRALARNPNQYIYRRRIQQYGPRLEKPYSFYDWVHAARKVIRARGEEPVRLDIEPGGAEIAYPSRTFGRDGNSPARKEPDPEGRIERDDAKLVEVEVGMAPASVQSGKSTRVHLVFRPSSERGAHWNNEAEGLVVWIGGRPSVEVDRHHLTAANAKKATSEEPREVEFEARVSKDAKKGKVSVPAYALYYVCEDPEGVCLYRRLDFEIGLEVEE